MKTDLFEKYLKPEIFEKIELISKSCNFDFYSYARYDEEKDYNELKELLEGLDDYLDTIERTIRNLKNSNYEVVAFDSDDEDYSKDFLNLIVDETLIKKLKEIDDFNAQNGITESVTLLSKTYPFSEITIYLGNGTNANSIYYDRITAPCAARDELEKPLQDNSMDLFQDESQENIDNLMQQVPTQETDEATQETDKVAQESIEQETTTQEQVQENVKDLLKSYVKDEAIEILDDEQARDLLTTLERINSVIAKFSKDEPSKLEKLKQEKAAALSDWASYSVNNAGGQPMNDKKNNRSFYNGLERVENRIRSLDEQIEKQESIEARKRERQAGYNKNGGLLLTIDNIDRIRLEIEKAAQGQSIYSAATIRKYKKALIELEKQLEATENNHNEKLDELVASGKLNQWKKQPTIFFLKGYRKLAIKMLDNGSFEIAKKYAPKDDKEKAAIENILNQLAA